MNAKSVAMRLRKNMPLRYLGNLKMLERIKQIASGELCNELAEALHWPFQ
jgi:hypothetical protein